MRQLPGLAIALLVASCASYTDMKTSVPAATIVAKGTPAALADCYVDKRMADHVENYQKLDLSGTLHLVVRDVPLWGPPTLLYELSFTPLDPANTRIELREAIKPILDIGHGAQNITQTAASCAPQAR